MKNLARIIQCEWKKIIEFVNYEIKMGYDKKLIAGIVLAGGGARLKDIAMSIYYGHKRIGYQ